MGILLSVSKVGESLYGGDFPTVTLEVEYQTRERLRVRLVPTGQERWKVPIPIMAEGATVFDILYHLVFTYEPVFSFKVGYQ